MWVASNEKQTLLKCHWWLCTGFNFSQWSNHHFYTFLWSLSLLLIAEDDEALFFFSGLILQHSSSSSSFCSFTIPSVRSWPARFLRLHVGENKTFFISNESFGAWISFKIPPYRKTCYQQLWCCCFPPQHQQLSIEITLSIFLECIYM